MTCYAYLRGCDYQLIINGMRVGAYPGQPETEAAAIARGYRVQAWRDPKASECACGNTIRTEHAQCWQCRAQRERSTSPIRDERLRRNTDRYRILSFLHERAGEWFTAIEVSAATGIGSKNISTHITQSRARYQWLPRSIASYPAR